MSDRKHRHRQSTLLNVPEKSQYDMQHIAAHATPIAAWHCSLGQFVQLVERSRIRPKGEEDAPGNLINHAATRRQPLSRHPRPVRRIPDARRSCP